MRRYAPIKALQPHCNILFMSIVPKEVLWMVFAISGPSSFGIFRLVCKYWKHVVDSQIFKDYVNAMNLPFTSTHMSMFAQNEVDILNTNSVAEFDSTINEDYVIHNLSSDWKLEGIPEYDETRRDLGYTQGKKDRQQFKDLYAGEVSGSRKIKDKMIKQHSTRGNENNWDTSNIPNSIEATMNKSSELDVYFPSPKFKTIKEPKESKVAFIVPTPRNLSVSKPPPDFLHYDFLTHGGG